MAGGATATDQLLGIGDGVRTEFPLIKRYADSQERRITRPQPGSVSVAIDTVDVTGWSLGDMGVIIFDVAPLVGARVTAVEINPVAAALAELNAHANGLADRIEVRIGDLYEAVGDERFDLVSANPPLLPVPDDVPYPFVGHGGPDGLRITRRILAGLPRVLSDRGIARMLGTTLSDGYLPLCLDEMEIWAKLHSMNVIMSVTSHHGLREGNSYLEGLSQTSAGMGTISVEDARERYLTCFQSFGGTHMCAYFFHVTRGEGTFLLADLADDTPRDIWFVP